MNTSVKGFYENGELTLLEPAPDIKKSVVLVTFLIDKKQKNKGRKRVPGGLLRLRFLTGKNYSISDDFNEPLNNLKNYM